MKKVTLLKNKKNRPGFIDMTVGFVVFLALFAAFIAMGPGKEFFGNVPGGARYEPIATDPTDNEGLQLNPLDVKQAPIPQTPNCYDMDTLRSPEQRIMWAISPAPEETVGAGGSIKIWYNDEHALTLGYGSVSPNATPHVVNPNVGDESKRDSNNLPYFPALFITDITDDPANRSGDVQNNGTPHKPDEVWGPWISAGSSNEPPENNLQLPAGADPFPAESNIKFEGGLVRGREEEYGAEIIWKVDNILVNNQPLVPGRTYRAQFIVHDGDREGDVGVACTTIQM